MRFDVSLLRNREHCCRTEETNSLTPKDRNEEWPIEWLSPSQVFRGQDQIWIGEPIVRTKIGSWLIGSVAAAATWQCLDVQRISC
jgi:hypothetical protein